jgi:putative acetyltransferase
MMGWTADNGCTMLSCCKAMTAETELKIAVEDPSEPEIIALLRDGEAHSAKLYPAESNHHMSLSARRASNVRFLVVRDASGRAVGTGALALHGAWAELKRMWVIPEARRLGVSRIILAALEARARSEGVGILRLETGVQNHAALGLYARAGFQRRDPFGDYRADPLSVFMQKELSNSL